MTNPTTTPTGDIRAPIEEVTDMTNYILEAVKAYVIEKKPQMVSAFMALHSVHKVVVNDLAARWEMEGIPAQKTIRMADQTFRKAMRELIRNLPTESNSGLVSRRT